MMNRSESAINTLARRLSRGLASRCPQVSPSHGQGRCMYVGPSVMAGPVTGRWTQRQRPIAEQAGDDLSELAANLLEALAFECTVRTGVDYRVRPERRDMLAVGLDLADRVLKETGIETPRTRMLVARLGAALED